MKRYIFYIIGAFFAEIMIIAIATVFNLKGLNLVITVGLLPAGLILGSIIYLAVKFFLGSAEEEPEKDEPTK